MTEQIITAYVERVRSEHRELQGLVHQVRRALAVAARAGWRDLTVSPLVETLKQLQGYMEHHFAQEEAGGYLDEALIQAPRFSHEAERLMRQHPQLLQQVRELLVEIPGCQQRPALWCGFEAHAHAALQQVLAHEAAENQILERAYNTTLDVEVE